MNKYHKRFINSRSSENVIGLFSRYHNAHKEITESWAMLEAAKKVINDLSQYKIIVVGDGASPRTGAIFAYYTKAEVISVDPQFNIDHWIEHCQKQKAMGFPVERLKVYIEKIKDVAIDCEEKSCLVVWPHSRADMNNTNIFNYKYRIDIAMPCCKPIPGNWMKFPHIVYDNLNVISPKRTIHIWGSGLKLSKA